MFYIYRKRKLWIIAVPLNCHITAPQHFCLKWEFRKFSSQNSLLLISNRTLGNGKSKQTLLWNSPQSFVPWQKHLFLLIFHASFLSPKSAEWMKGKESVTRSKRAWHIERSFNLLSLWRDRLSSDGSGFDLNPFKHFAHRSNSVTVKCEMTKGKHFIEWLRGKTSLTIWPYSLNIL